MQQPAPFQCPRGAGIKHRGRVQVQAQRAAQQCSAAALTRGLDAADAAGGHAAAPRHSSRL